jgi:predicted small lipoprotein YifL
MKTRFLSLLALASVLSFASCGDSAKRTDGTAGEAVSDIDKAAADGGVEADATVIDNDAGPTVTADADSAMATDSAGGARP